MDVQKQLVILNLSDQNNNAVMDGKRKRDLSWLGLEI